ncbi:hypothetical protein IWQ60_009041 [Tieghemiomyces parasiticus]|uniref:Uncharacterized protein n=1 Tax=Tieghemiomyces parasiticus TaxID=78921 RepID=A0A9W7ZW89_9FUNG|nr:hypothetical protein IWQ60_009041 [Tieghemiomyces parasiticus]
MPLRCKNYMTALPTLQEQLRVSGDPAIDTQPLEVAKFYHSLQPALRVYTAIKLHRRLAEAWQRQSTDQPLLSDDRALLEQTAAIGVLFSQVRWIDLTALRRNSRFGHFGYYAACRSTPGDTSEIEGGLVLQAAVKHLLHLHSDPDFRRLIGDDPVWGEPVKPMVHALIMASPGFVHQFLVNWFIPWAIYTLASNRQFGALSAFVGLPKPWTPLPAPRMRRLAFLLMMEFGVTLDEAQKAMHIGPYQEEELLGCAIHHRFPLATTALENGLTAKGRYSSPRECPVSLYDSEYLRIVPSQHVEVRFFV